MRKSFAAALLGLALTLPGKVQADAYCSGTISQIYTDKGGAVVILSSWRNDWTQICNIKTEWKGVDPQVCWEWFAHATQAKTNSLTVGIYYFGIPSNGCATSDEYGDNAPPEYFRLQ